MLAEMKVDEVQEYLKKRKEPKSGMKAVLLVCMEEALSKEYSVHKDSTTTT